MADWKTQISYNYNQPYAYVYTLNYPAGPEQVNGNMPGWNNGEIPGFNNFAPAVNQVYYAAPARSEETPPHTPEEGAFDGLYQNPQIVYYEDTEESPSILTGTPRPNYKAHGNDRRISGETTSDAEHASSSPESWSSGSRSSQENGLPKANPATWVAKGVNEVPNPPPVSVKDIKSDVDNAKPDATVEVSSSVKKERRILPAVSNGTADTTTSPQAPAAAQNDPSSNTKGKVRVAFTDDQMEALHTRFTVQKYLTPAEMKQLAESTGLMYKQVKTWFQNRRMKHRRHQKDKNWVSERYTLRKNVPNGGPVYPNYPSHMQPYPGETMPPVNPHMRDVTFKKPACYLPVMDNCPGSAGYSGWSPGIPQATFPNCPQTSNWPVHGGISPYEYSPETFNPAMVAPSSQDAMYSKDQEEINAFNGV